MAETATRRRNGTAPKAGGASKARNGRNGGNGGGPAVKPKAAAGGGATKAATKPTTRATTKTTKKSTAKPASKPAGKRASSTSSPDRSSGTSGSPSKRVAAKAKDAVKAVTPSTSAVKHPVRKLALTGIKRMAKSALGGAATAGATLIRAAADRAAATGHEAVGQTARRRLPIQRSVDIAVPLRVVWEEWSALESIPEGVHTVTEIDREGDELTGRTSGPKGSDWAAEILDERPEQSFAWQSHDGADCAGLITFHELSRRLTRVELNLDVVPIGPLETAQLATRLADRRAEAELRRFKARLELINPDLYEDDPEDEAADGDAPPEPVEGPEMNEDPEPEEEPEPEEDPEAAG